MVSLFFLRFVGVFTVFLLGIVGVVHCFHVHAQQKLIGKKIKDSQFHLD